MIFSHQRIAIFSTTPLERLSEVIKEPAHKGFQGLCMESAPSELLRVLVITLSLLFCQSREATVTKATAMCLIGNLGGIVSRSASEA